MKHLTSIVLGAAVYFLGASTTSYAKVWGLRYACEHKDELGLQGLEPAGIR
jgi:hypothetical protein